MSTSGIFQAAEDFAVLGFYNAYDYFKHLRQKHLPRTDLSGLIRLGHWWLMTSYGDRFEAYQEPFLAGSRPFWGATAPNPSDFGRPTVEPPRRPATPIAGERRGAARPCQNTLAGSPYAEPPSPVTRVLTHGESLRPGTARPRGGVWLPERGGVNRETTQFP